MFTTNRVLLTAKSSKIKNRVAIGGIVICYAYQTPPRTRALELHNTSTDPL